MAFDPTKNIDEIVAVFFGSDVRMIEAVSHEINIVSVFAESFRITPQLETFAYLHDIEIKAVEESRNFIDTGLNADLGISCGFGQIFSTSAIECFRHGIMNIHFGDLPANRGRHPLTWEFLGNKRNITVSIHSINEKIDQGLLLNKFDVRRNFDDCFHDIESRILEVVGDEVKTAFFNLISGDTKLLSTGSYRENMASFFKQFDPALFDAKFILNAIRAQRSYGGINISGRVVTEAYICSADLSGEGYFSCSSKDGLRIWLR